MVVIGFEHFMLCDVVWCVSKHFIRCGVSSNKKNWYNWLRTLYVV